MEHNPIIEQTALTTRLTVVGDYREFVTNLHIIGADKLCDEWARFVHQYIGNVSDRRITLYLTDLDAMFDDIRDAGTGYGSHAIPAEINGLSGAVVLAVRRELDGRLVWTVSTHT